MDMQKSYSVRVPKVVLKLLLVVGLCAGLYFGIMWAGNYIMIMPTSEFNQAFQ